MSSREISFWIDERWYDALSKPLQGETLEEHLEDVVDEMVNQLPDVYKRQMWRSCPVSRFAMTSAASQITPPPASHPSIGGTRDLPRRCGWNGS